jgi:hypothetical protein
MWLKLITNYSIGGASFYEERYSVVGSATYFSLVGN